MLLLKNSLTCFQKMLKRLYLFYGAASRYDLDISMDCLGLDRLDNPAEIAIWGNLRQELVVCPACSFDLFSSDDRMRYFLPTSQTVIAIILENLCLLLFAMYAIRLAG